MDRVEVDPDSFIICRLCLEDKGVYQIVPTVIQKIKYCFDIDVAPFDGLSQLICKKCECTLRNFYEVKKTYSDKQNELKSKMYKKEEPVWDSNEPQHEIVSSSQQGVSESVENFKQFKRIYRLSSSYESTDLESNKSIGKQDYKNNAIEGPRKKFLWRRAYGKQFVCRLCGKYYKKRIDLNKHVPVHNTLLVNFQHILDKPCHVILNKVNNEPNITGDTKAIVYSHERIICNKMYKNYYVEYCLKRTCKSESESDNDVINKKQRTRTLSDYSSETMVIENSTKEDHNYSHLQDNDNECIKIDSDSSSESESNVLELKVLPPKANFVDCKTIQNIVLNCQNKHMKKPDVDNPNDVNTKEKLTVESRLKHIVLSIGRKIINNQPFSCSGLLRYLEKKNLNIVWIPAAPKMNGNKELNFVRIMTRLKNVKDNDINDWKQFKEFTNANLLMDVTNNSTLDEDLIESTAGALTNNTVKTSVQTSSAEKIPHEKTENISHSNTDMKSKLLNESPVSNPKQLPKKKNCEELQLQVECEKGQNASKDKCDSVFINLDDECENSMPMPIITSTESLAPQVNTYEINSNNGNNIASNNNNVPFANNRANATTVNNLEVSLPRIKVKPVSELMAPVAAAAVRTINQQTGNMVGWLMPDKRLNQPYINTVATSNVPPVYVNIPPNLQTDYVSTTNLVSVPAANTSMPIKPTVPAANSEPPAGFANSDYVILDTKELPNTKTSSPFQYFKKLLQLYGILLTDSNVLIVPQAYHGLLKFQVQFTQDNKEVKLNMSLCTLGNQFCVKISDINQQEIDINKIPAIWQWELLKVTQTDNVTEKLKLNANEIGPVACAHTQTFITVLKSINIKTFKDI